MANRSSGASSPPESNQVRSLNLSRFRQKQGVSLEQIAEKTKISIRFLRAIESEEFDKLPGGVFNTSYIRQYAALAGFNEGDILAQYSQKTAPGDGQVAEVGIKAPAAQTQTRFGRWLRLVAEAARS